MSRRVVAMAGQSMARARSLTEFQEAFPDEAGCAAFLFERRWQGGFVCPRCGGERVAALKSTITGFSEPQGVAYVPFADAIYVANAGDGSVRVLRGEDFTPIGRIELGDDADNVRIDTQRKRVLIGYGSGAPAGLGSAT